MTKISRPCHRVPISQDAANYRVHRAFTSDAVREYLVSLDCPRALTVWLLFVNNEHDQLVELVTRPADFGDARAFHMAYCATTLLSKSDFLKLGRDRVSVAIEKFESFEFLCGSTNRRFRDLNFDPLYYGSSVWLLNAVKRKISSVLGDYSLDEVFNHANWGPGVTLSIKGENATSVNKFQSETGITRDLYSHLCNDPQYIEGKRYPLWQEHLASNPGFPTFEVGSVTVTVPKDAKTDRVICVEPGLNLWFQKGIGQMIRHRLRSKGVDLNDQSVNQRLAKIAQKAGLATVDFSSASDSIAYELVRELIPPDWFDAMESARSHYGRYKGAVRRWEKFSSMGNGFTFELESLIFFAAASAVAEFQGIDTPVISVYGDDVIIPSSCFELFSEFSQFLGFKVNKAKSYYVGPFRESCGSHYYSGVDVKPIFLKKRLTTLFSVFKFGNAIRRLAHQSLNGLGCDRQFKVAFEFMVHSVPKKLLFRLPDGYGDGGFVGNLDESCPQRARKFPSQEGYFTRTLRFSPVKDESEGVGLFLSQLRRGSARAEDDVYFRPEGRTTRTLQSKYGAIKSTQVGDFRAVPIQNPVEEGNFFALRGRVRHNVGKLFVNQWYDLGPWI